MQLLLSNFSVFSFLLSIFALGISLFFHTLIDGLKVLVLLKLAFNIHSSLDFIIEPLLVVSVLTFKLFPIIKLLLVLFLDVLKILLSFFNKLLFALSKDIKAFFNFFKLFQLKLVFLMLFNELFGLGHQRFVELGFKEFSLIEFIMSLKFLDSRIIFLTQEFQLNDFIGKIFDLRVFELEIFSELINQTARLIVITISASTITNKLLILFFLFYVGIEMILFYHRCGRSIFNRQLSKVLATEVTLAFMRVIAQKFGQLVSKELLNNIEIRNISIFIP